jgi:hypothetical protein
MKPPIVGACVLLVSCAASRTMIQSQWADDAYSGPPLERVAVVALFDTRADSLSFERSAADYLATQGVEVVPGHTLLTPEETQTLDERREYQVPTPYLLNTPAEVVTGDPSSWYYNTPTSSYYWFWRSSAEVTGTPGYWIEQSFVVAETALFDNRSDRLLWTAKSETMDDERFQRTSESIVRAVARELAAADLIAGMDAKSVRPAERQSRAGPG